MVAWYDEKNLQGHDNTIICLSITPDGKYVITGSCDKTAIIWDIETGKELKKLQGHNGSIKCLAITQDGKKVITGSEDGTAIIWDIKTGKQITRIEGYYGIVECLAITPDGKKVIIGSRRGAAIWDIETGELITRLQGHYYSIRCLAITPDSKKVVTGSDDETAIIWDIRSDKLSAELERLSFTELRIIEMAFKAAQKNKKVRLPEKGESKKVFDKEPELIKSLIKEYVEIVPKVESKKNMDGKDLIISQDDETD